MDCDITTLDRGDRIGLYLAVATAVVVIAFVGWGVARNDSAEVAPGHDIPVAVPLAGRAGRAAARPATRRR